MIGNDIIDLALAQKESNWRRKGFLDKVFTPREQRLIMNSNNPEIMVWNLWGRKEAAYKIYNRQTHQRVLIPLKLECFDSDVKEESIHGTVICYDTTYFTKTNITSDFVETIAVLNIADFDKIKPFFDQQKIVKINGVPNYFDEKELVLKPVSRSHHGRFERMIRL